MDAILAALLKDISAAPAENTPQPLSSVTRDEVSTYDFARYEFLLDFGQFHPESANVALHTRIALGPSHAKLLSQLFAAAVREYEARSGEIASVAESPDPLAVVLRSLPDFERRAVDARRRATGPMTTVPARRAASKR